MNQLIVFTRLPCAGRNKTRLIPALGAEGAAQFHDRLARHTVRRASAFCMASPNIKLIIRIDGGSVEDGENWLGKHDFREQGDGDLGERLDRAVCNAFAEGAEKVIVIGTDCPEIDHATLSQAIKLLDDHPLVFGPAFDGGYYLIGLTKPCSDMFQNIAWGSENVLSQSISAAERAGLSYATLHYLPDVDTPEDIPAAKAALADS